MFTIKAVHGRTFRPRQLWIDARDRQRISGVSEAASPTAVRTTSVIVRSNGAEIEEPLMLRKRGRIGIRVSPSRRVSPTMPTISRHSLVAPG